MHDLISNTDETNHAEMQAINENLVIAAVRQQQLAEAAHQSAEASHQFAEASHQRAEAAHQIAESSHQIAESSRQIAEVARRAEQRLRHLVHGLDAVICEIDTRTGRPAFLSLRAETFLGHPVDRWHAQPNFLTEIIHPSDRARAAALVPEFVREGESYEYEFRALSADTEWIWMRNIVRLVYDRQKNVDLLRCVIVDVTAQKRTAQALEVAYERERHIAETLQRSLLFMPPEDSFPGLAVKTCYEAASDESLVGGDFWDTFACDHGHVAFILGDVMGHGLPAAVFTAELKYTLRGFVREHERPARILEQMNAYLYESFRLHGEGLNEEGNDDPVCLTLVILDTATGQGSIAVAGMEPPLLVRRSGQMHELKIDGILLGLVQETQYTEQIFHLDPGDWLIVTTDGVTEARQGKVFLGYEGLMRLAQEAHSQEAHSQKTATLEKMGQAILDGAKAFADGELRDDASVLLVRRQ